MILLAAGITIYLSVWLCATKITTSSQSLHVIWAPCCIIIEADSANWLLFGPIRIRVVVESASISDDRLFSVASRMMIDDGALLLGLRAFASTQQSRIGGSATANNNIDSIASFVSFHLAE